MSTDGYVSFGLKFQLTITGNVHMLHVWHLYQNKNCPDVEVYLRADQ